MRKRPIAWIAGVTTAGAVAALAWIILTPAPRPSVVVTLDSVPSGASVFSDNEFFDAAPVRIRLEPGETRTFRLVKRDFDDTFVSVRADDFIPSTFWPRWWARRRALRRTLRVPLIPMGSSALAITSDPSGAVVYADGRRLGATPLLVEELRPGRHTLYLEHADCYRDTFQTVLKPGERNSAHRTLRAKMPVLYRELLAREPGSLFRYTELIQYYVSAGDYENAVKYLREGYEVVKRPDASEHDEYFTMLKKIYDRWFEYPEEGEMANIRPLCRELIVKARKERLWDVSSIQKHIDEMNKYDRLHRGRQWIRR